MINSLNYKIQSKTNLSERFLKLSTRHFRGSTAIYAFVAKLFFRKSFFLIIDGESVLWPIDSISDFRLLRGDYIVSRESYRMEVGYEGIDLSFVKTLINKGDVILDLGANKGFYTLFFSKKVGPEGKVISIEASNNTFTIFLRRIKTVWNLENVLPLNFILGSTNSEPVSLTRPSVFDDGTGTYFEKKRNFTKNYSYTRTLDTILGSLNLNKIKIIKMDVEGAEMNVLLGSGKVLEKAEFLLIEVSSEALPRFGYKVSDLYTLVKENNFNYAYSITSEDLIKPTLVKVNNATGNILFSKVKLID